MMRIFLTFLLLFCFWGVNAQNQIDWDSGVVMQLSDFQSDQSQVGGVDLYSLRSSVSMDFAYSMNSGAFMFTKNFNDKVSCKFDKYSSVLIAPDSSYANQLLSFARFEFDLSELHARILRKKLFEEKNAFSEMNFFQAAYNEVQRLFSQRHSSAAKQTDLGKDKMKLQELHLEVKKEILQLAEFCKSCKPTKKKKPKR